MGDSEEGKRLQRIIMATTALHPLVYLPFHLASNHLSARIFPNRQFTYPALVAFTLLQYGVEHFGAELPTLASYNEVLVPIAIAIGPLSYYFAHKRWSEARCPKYVLWLGIASFPFLLGFFKGFEFGFPKDDPMEQAAANLDPTHSYKHLILHIAILIQGAAVSYGVPWDVDCKGKEKMELAKAA